MKDEQAARCGPRQPRPTKLDPFRAHVLDALRQYRPVDLADHSPGYLWLRPASTHMNRPGLVVLYRWRLRPGAETSFIEAWSRVTELLRDREGSLGSRLHRGNDGIWYGYAQWPNEETRRRAFAQPVDPAAVAQMRAGIAESLPEVLLEPVSDFLLLPKEREA
ncbi:MAG: antibiotic biosynthesis monooxygenase [Burkholderiales bacterium]